MEMQKNIFLKEEADKWFLRNESAIKGKSKSDDTLYSNILSLTEKGFTGTGKKILEVGCANGYRLAWFKELGFQVKGIDPSALAIDSSIKSGLLDSSELEVSDACTFFDSNTEEFDIILFGHSLYLVDPSDYPAIVNGTMSSLCANGFIGIYDFQSIPHKRNYCHYEGVFSYKMNFSDLFTWHPQFQLMAKWVEEHDKSLSVGDRNEDCSFSLIRKLSIEKAFPTIE